jgi:hypothetical protein
MKYLTKHLTIAAYNQVRDTLDKPHVALVMENGLVDYMPSD